MLASNEQLIRQMVHDRAGSVMRWTGLDETLATKIIDGLNGLLTGIAEDPDHPLREKAEAGLAALAHDLINDPRMRERVAAVKSEIIDNPAMQRWLDGLWEQARGGMLRIARNPDAMLAGPVGDALRQLGETLQTDAKLRATINRFVRRAVVGMAADYGDGIVRLVSETIQGWDAGTITRRRLGLGRITTSHHRSSTSYQTVKIFGASFSETTMRPNPTAAAAAWPQPGRRR